VSEQRESSFDVARRFATTAVLGVLALASFVMTISLSAGIADSLRGRQLAPWILGRASGFTSYTLIVLLVSMGLVLSHPASRRVRRPSPEARLRIHLALAIFTLVFTVLHVVVLATDPFAGVGWRGVFVPMAASYRPVGVTFGVVAVYAGLITGVTAAFAGRWAGRIWWPIHKVSAVVLALVWAHGFWTGIDTASMVWFYLATGGLVLALALSRYLAKSPADRLDEIVRADAGATIHGVSR
jgi:Ferric reductase like transmembrane component